MVLLKDQPTIQRLLATGPFPWSHRDDAINDFWVHGSTWRVLSWPGRVNDEDFAGTGDGV